MKNFLLDVLTVLLIYSLSFVLVWCLFFGEEPQEDCVTIPEEVTEERIKVADERIEVPEEEIKPVYTSLGWFKCTAYCSCEKCCGKWAKNRPKDDNGNEIVYTASGAVAHAWHTVAVDPELFDYGQEFKCIYNGQELTLVAEDCGSAINGNRIDIYFSDHADAVQFGVQYIELFVRV